jgi:Flp pilus assembly protein TadD
VKSSLLLLAALAIPPALSAQDDRLRMYRVSLTLYRGGHVDEALRIAGGWRTATVRSDVRRLIEDRDVRLAPGVALLLTELARRDTQAGAPERFSAAETIVSDLPRVSPDIEAFRERWYAFMASMFIDDLDPSGARRLLDRALRVVGDSARLQFLSGIAFELATYPHATCAAANCRVTDDQRARHLALASGAYRQAIALNPRFPESHLRLGRVLYQLGDRGGARRALVDVEQLTGRADLLYLVALFHADLNLEAGDLPGAVTEVEHAVSLGPHYQSARIALAHLSDQLGMTDRSRQIVSELLQLPEAGDPWWEFRQPTLDTESLQWMRIFLRQ